MASNAIFGLPATMAQSAAHGQLQERVGEVWSAGVRVGDVVWQGGLKGLRR